MALQQAAQTDIPVHSAGQPEAAPPPQARLAALIAEQERIFTARQPGSRRLARRRPPRWPGG